MKSDTIPVSLEKQIFFSVYREDCRDEERMSKRNTAKLN